MKYDEFIQIKKREYLLDVLKETKGNQCAAAVIAGVHRNTIKRLMAEVGIRALTVRMFRRASVVRE